MNKRLLKTAHSSRALYLLLSCISGIVELGVPLLAFYTYYSPMYLIIVAIIYQCSSFLAKHIKMPLYACLLSAILGTLAISVNWSQPFYWFAGAAFLISTGLHGARVRAKNNTSKISTSLKRSVRVIGFVLAGFSSQWFIAVAGWIIVTCLLISPKHNSECVQSSKIFGKISFLGVIMVIHQMHYFVYCYVVLYWIAELLPSLKYLCGALFSIGWLSYLTSKSILKGLKTHIVLIFGHISLSFLLFILFLENRPSIILLIVIWFLTGFGGGTVFCIKRSNDILPIEDRVDLEIWEDIGHVAGVLACLAINLTTNSLSITFLAGGGMALLTAFLYSFWHISSGKRKHNIVV